METKLTRRQLQGLKTKQKIFDTAVQLINLYGYDNVTVKQICKEVGISIGCFYHHFRNKDEIIVESFGQIDSFFEDIAPEVLQLPDALDRIVLYFTFFGQYVDLQGVDFNSQLTKSELSTTQKFTLNEERSIFTILHKIIMEGQQSGEIRDDILADKIASDLLRFARGIAIHWCISRGSYNIEDEIAKSVSLYTICLKPQA